VVRPAEGETGRWKVRFTRRRADEETELRCELEIDPKKRWWVTRIIRERAGTWRSETKAEYEQVGGALMPVTHHTRTTYDQGGGSARWRLRPMSEVEQREFKECVEQVARTGPRDPFQWLRRFLLAIVIACPLGGAATLSIARRCSPRGTP
jgi:hypothetical protein